MLKINRGQQSFVSLDMPSMAAVSLTERYDLQEFISNSPVAFFKELGLNLFLVGKEIEPSRSVQDRIDLLAVDREGNCAVVELKRGANKLQLLQAISYAGMVSHWSADDFLQLLSEERQEELVEFLDVDIDEINRQQRIVLIAEAYDYALLVSAEWLSDKYGVDIRCCRIAVAMDSATETEYLVCSNVYPMPELTQQAAPRGRLKTGATTGKWADWESALAPIENPAVSDFYKAQLAKERESYLLKRTLYYRTNGKRRWWIHARRKIAYVWQFQRFDGDVEFWQSGISDAGSVQPVKDGKCLRFFLHTASDFEFFDTSASVTLVAKDFHNALPEDEVEEEQDD